MVSKQYKASRLLYTLLHSSFISYCFKFSKNEFQRDPLITTETPEYLIS